MQWRNQDHLLSLGRFCRVKYALDDHLVSYTNEENLTVSENNDISLLAPNLVISKIQGKMQEVISKNSRMFLN